MSRGLTVLLVVLALAAGCAEPAPPGEGSAPSAADAITETSQEGPVKAVVSLTPKEPEVGDPLVLVLEVEAEPGVTLELPDFGEALGRFSIVDFTPREERRPDGGTLASQRYTLQAPMSGRQRIPPLRIEFVDERPGQAPDADLAPTRELLTEELTVNVASVLPEGAVADQLRPARGALPERVPGRFAQFWPLLLALTLAAAVAGLWLLWRRRSRALARVSAYDRAVERLVALERRGFPSAEQADGWYVELSAIVRRYLEDRYAVRAPELTTEEFLREARRSRELSGSHRELLGLFLEQCDRVKFAAYVPDEAESRKALESARRFLAETRVTVEHERAAAAAARAA